MCLGVSVAYGLLAIVFLRYFERLARAKAAFALS
jgi:hypothetical protein